MISYWINSAEITEDIFIPKYYNPQLKSIIESLKNTHDLIKLSSLIEDRAIEVSTGDEIGKMAYGTGSIPFVRTSDISNWEIKSLPKQGISEEIYEKYCSKQDVRAEDLLLIKDGTYLIGGNCFITKFDTKMVYQSHILKFRINSPEKINPEILFLLFNSRLVQEQIRAIQFTADIIDTIGQRYKGLILPFPKDKSFQDELSNSVSSLLYNRNKNRILIKNFPTIVEDSLEKNSTQPFEDFSSLNDDSLLDQTTSDTITGEFGEFEAFWLNNESLKKDIYLPKYYDPLLEKELLELKKNCSLITIEELVNQNIISINTGDEIGKMAYGTGDIPFIRTSDFSNWEIKHDPKQGISEEIYSSYKDKQNVEEGDIFLVRDGTYLVGTSCIVTKQNEKCLYCGGIYRIKILDKTKINPFLFLGLLNSYIVKRQIRTKQFTRDVIDTLGTRFSEIVIPLPKNDDLCRVISEVVCSAITQRIEARDKIKELTRKVVGEN